MLPAQPQARALPRLKDRVMMIKLVHGLSFMPTIILLHIPLTTSQNGFLVEMRKLEKSKVTDNLPGCGRIVTLNKIEGPRSVTVTSRFRRRSKLGSKLTWFHLQTQNL